MYKEEFGKRIAKIYELMLAKQTGMLDELGVNPADYNVFLTIDEYPGCTQLFIANKRNVERSLLTRVIKRYIDRGYIVREISTQNKSAYSLHLTVQGNKVVTEIRHCIAQINESIQQLFPENVYDEMIVNLDQIITSWEGE
jgi:DNA-binding MarR family transcriptional regulator